jgi:hypothetical protein
VDSAPSRPAFRRPQPIVIAVRDPVRVHTGSRPEFCLIRIRQRNTPRASVPEPPARSALPSIAPTMRRLLDRLGFGIAGELRDRRHLALEQVVNPLGLHCR